MPKLTGKGYRIVFNKCHCHVFGIWMLLIFQYPSLITLSSSIPAMKLWCGLHQCGHRFSIQEKNIFLFEN